MAYVPKPAPLDAGDFQSWAQQEFQALAQAWEQTQPYVLLDTLYAQPKKPREGMVVKADGTTWNPGSGAGVYCRRGGAWTFLG